MEVIICLKKQHENNCTIILKKTQLLKSEISLNVYRFPQDFTLFKSTEYVLSEIIENKMEHIELELELHHFCYES